MATSSPRSKQSKWFSSKSLRLSLNRQRSKSRSNSSHPSSPKSSLTPRLSNKEAELEVVFRHFDGDGDGKISPVELRSYFASIDEYMSNEEARGIINDLDSDGDNMLDFQDFKKLMKIGKEKEELDDIRNAFEMFELEKGAGCITPKGLQKMLEKSLGDSKSLEECASMIQIFDIDGNGVLDFDEFHQMMIA